MVAKFFATALGMRNTMNKPQLTKYIGFRPICSDSGAMKSGTTADANWRAVVAKYSQGKASCEMPNADAIASFAAP